MRAFSERISTRWAQRRNAIPLSAVKLSTVKKLSTARLACDS